MRQIPRRIRKPAKTLPLYEGKLDAIKNKTFGIWRNLTMIRDALKTAELVRL